MKLVPLDTASGTNYVNPNNIEMLKPGVANTVVHFVSGGTLIVKGTLLHVAEIIMKIG